MKNAISIDIKSEGHGKYDAYISAECSTGLHYEHVTAKEIGDYVAKLIDCLEETDSGKSYLNDSERDEITELKERLDLVEQTCYILNEIIRCDVDSRMAHAYSNDMDRLANELEYQDSVAAYLYPKHDEKDN